MSVQNVQVALLVQPYATYTYSLPEIYSTLPKFERNSICGCRVCVPLGRRKQHVVGIITDSAPPIIESTITVRPVAWIFDRIALFTPSYVAMVRELATRYAVTEGIVYRSILPSPLRSIAGKVRFFGDSVDVLRVGELCSLSEEQKRKYISLWWEEKYAFVQQNTHAFDMYRLAKEPPWSIRSSAHAQRTLLHALWEEGDLTRDELIEYTGIRTNTVLKQLISSGFIEVEKVQEDAIKKSVCYTRGEEDIELEKAFEKRKSYRRRGLPPCTLEQEKVLESLKTSLDEGTRVELLFGVTGSGKSRVYCELIDYVLQQGKNILLLAPEIALVQKLVDDIEAFFIGVPYYVYHGYQNPLSKLELFKAVSKSKQASIVIGTRSALFVPLHNIGLCILDEEHDSSYKQEHGAFLYNAKDVAWYLSKSHGAMLLLGSATPDCKTLYAADKGSIGKHMLTTRATGVQMPTLEFIDMKAEKNLLSQRAVEVLSQVVAKKEQAIILLNRRGYAPHMYCTACDHVQQCPHCEVSLLYHKTMNILRCSYCGYHEYFPKPCSHCGSMQYITLGIGTEQLEEELNNLFPSEEDCIRLDRDIARSPHRIASILERFSAGESSILVGTQMLAKGHNFPKVTLSLIVDADSGLHFPDYRAMERVFQLIVQTAGRAGRGEQQGHVIIQSYCVDNPCWQFVLDNNYMGLYEHEMAVREKRLYPPFVHIALIRIVCTMDYEEAKQYIRMLMQSIRIYNQEKNCIVLGPVPSPIALIRSQYRYQILVKSTSWQHIRGLYMTIKNAVSKKKDVRVTLDIDPVSMM